MAEDGAVDRSTRSGRPVQLDLVPEQGAEIVGCCEWVGHPMPAPLSCLLFQGLLCRKETVDGEEQEMTNEVGKVGFLRKICNVPACLVDAGCAALCTAGQQGANRQPRTA